MDDFGNEVKWVQPAKDQYVFTDPWLDALVEALMPKIVEALRKRGVYVGKTTEETELADAHARKLLGLD